MLKFFEKHANTELSHTILHDSKKEGPTVFIFAAVHGNEVEPLKALMDLCENLKTADSLLKGKVFFILGNPKAVEQNVRYTEFDLNRSFHDTPNNTYEFKRAQEIKEFIDKHKTVHTIALDLHTVSVDDTQIRLYKIDCSESKKIVEAISPISLTFTFSDNHVPGILISHTYKHDIPSVVIECGNHTDPNSKLVASYHTYNLLKYLDMIEHTPDITYQRQSITNKRWYDVVHAIPVDVGFSFLDNNISSEQFVKKGETYAKTSTEEISAEQDGYILMPSKLIRPTDVDAGFFCRKIEEQEQK